MRRETKTDDGTRTGALRGARRMIDLRRRKFFARLLRVTLLLTLCPILLLTAINSLATARSLDHEISAQYDFALRDIKGSIEQSLSAIRANMVNFLYSNKSVAYFLAQSGPAENFAMTCNLVKDIAAFRHANDAIADVFAYVVQDDFLATSLGSYYSDFFFDKFQPAALRALILSPSGFAMDGLANVTHAIGVSPRSLLLHLTLPVDAQDYRFSFTAVVTQSTLLSALNGVNLPEKSSFVLIAPNGEVVASNASESMTAALEARFPAGEAAASGGRLELDGERHLYKLLDSAEGFRYMLLLPYGVIAARVAENIVTGVLAGLLLTVVCVLLSFLATFRLYRPIERLMAFFGDSRFAEDEMNHIAQGVGSLLAANESLRGHLVQVIPVLQQSLLKRLLEGEIDAGELSGELERHALLFPYPHCAVWALRPRQGGALSASEVKARLADVAPVLHVVTREDCLLILMNFDVDPGANVAACLGDLDAALARGAATDEPVRVARSCAQARSALMCRTLKAGFQDLDEGDFAADDSETEERKRFADSLSRALDASRFDEARALCADALAQWIRPSTPLWRMRRDLEWIWARLAECGARYGIGEACPARSRADAFWARWPDFAAAEEVSGAFLPCCEALIAQCQSRRQEANSGILREVSEYIDAHLGEDVSLEKLAEQFHVSYAHLSKLMKAYWGEGFAAYLTRLRIERAKRLLATTQLRVEDIARDVGYQSAITFIRNFNKQEGTSPGRYRSALALANESSAKTGEEDETEESL